MLKLVKSAAAQVDAPCALPAEQVAELHRLRARMRDAAVPLDAVGRRCDVLLTPAGEALQQARQALALAEAKNAEVIAKEAEARNIPAWFGDARETFAAKFPESKLPVRLATIRSLQRRLDQAELEMLGKLDEAEAIKTDAAPAEAEWIAASAAYRTARLNALLTLVAILERRFWEHRRAAARFEAAASVVAGTLAGAVNAQDRHRYTRHAFEHREVERHAYVVVERMKAALDGFDGGAFDFPATIFDVEPRQWPGPKVAAQPNADVSQSLNLDTGRLTPSGEYPTPEQRARFR